jgi:hypothetical protein
VIVTSVFDTAGGQVLVEVIALADDIADLDVDVSWRSGPDDVWGPKLEPIEVSAS